MSSSGKFAARAISTAFSLSIPVSGLTSTRASAYLYNTPAEVDAFLEGVRGVTAFFGVVPTQYPQGSQL